MFNSIGSIGTFKELVFEVYLRREMKFALSVYEKANEDNP